MFPHFDQSEYANALKNAYRQYPAKDSTLDIDFVNNRQRAAGLYNTALNGVTFTRTTTGTYFDATGTMQTAAINTPRFDYDPILLRPLGLLIEESRANDIRYSSDFRDTASVGSTRPWSNSGTVVTPESAVAPDGTLTAQLINSSAEAGVRQANSITNQTITASIFVKAGTAPTLRFRDDNNGTSVIFSPVTGIISSQSGVSAASCQSVGAGWFRIIVTYTTTTASWALNIRPTSAGTFYAWGAQLEAGGFATSYIPTTTASATRGADVASMAGANFSSWYNQSAGSILAIVTPRSVSGTSSIARFDDTTANEVISVRGNTSNPELYIVDGGVVQAQIDAGTLIANTLTSLAAAWQVNDAAISQNGQPSETDSSLTLPTPTQLRIGSDGTNYLNGWLSRLVYYPKRLPNNLLQSISRLTV